MSDDEIDYTPLPRRGEEKHKPPPAPRKAAPRPARPAEEAEGDTPRPASRRKPAVERAPAPQPVRREAYVPPSSRGRSARRSANAKRSGKRGSFFRSKGFIVLASLAGLVVLVGGGLLVELLPQASVPQTGAAAGPTDEFLGLALEGDRYFDDGAALLLADETAAAQAAFSQAAAYYEQAAALSPGDPSVLYCLGVAYLVLGRTGDAAAMWPQVVQVGSGSYYERKALDLLANQEADGVFLALAQAGDFYYDQGSQVYQQQDATAALAAFRQAAVYYEKALTRNPADPYVRTYLGTMYHYQGVLAGDQALIARAIQAWQTALDYSPDMPEALFNLGLGYVDLGQIDEARAMWQRVIEVAPGTTAAQQAQTMLDQYAGQSPW